MNKSDLRTGDIVELKNRDKCILLNRVTNCEGHDAVLVDINDGEFVEFSAYNENLECIGQYDSPEFNIMKVYSSNYIGDSFKKHINSNTDEWTWVREEKKTEIEKIENKIFHIETQLAAVKNELNDIGD